jgi:DHA1 family tetracycline resistance protein-like MFS transporter
MAIELKSTGFISSFQTLKGNTRISVIFEPLWGIPYAIYSFYLSLYMKSQGISDQQIGFLISIGFIASIIFSAVAGMITDTLGRRKATLIFDLISWPVSLLLYLLSGNFWLFAIIQVINSLSKIPGVSWNLMLIEDAAPHQQVIAYNLINTINISVGIFTPLAGIMIRELGIVTGERVLLVFAIISMTIMIFARNHYYRETTIGQQILDERREHHQRRRRKFDLSFFKILVKKPLVTVVLLCSILFNAYIPIGTYSSLYYAPFLTEVLKLDKSAIAILGGINAAVMLIIFVFIIPRLVQFNRLLLMAAGLALQISALLLFILIPPGHFFIAVACVILFASGFGFVKPFMDAVLAEVTAGKERAAIYAFHNTTVAIFSAGFGFMSGFLYALNPALLYMLSIGILATCIGILTWLGTSTQGGAVSETVNG